MAGERIGKTYEALLKIILDRLKDKHAFEGNVFWNETPDGISVEPDFYVGPDKDHPTIIFMVTHSGSSRNSDMKCWRNIGELCEVKSVLPQIPYAVNVVFDSLMKENLKKLQKAAFDAQLIVGSAEYGPNLQKWVESNEGSLPTEQVEKARFISVLSDDILSPLLSALEEDLLMCIRNYGDGLSELWNAERKRKHKIAPNAKNTHLRRGFTKRILVGDAFGKKGIRNIDVPWLFQLGLISKNISGYRVVDEDLNWFMSTPFEPIYKQIAAPCVSTGFYQQIEKVRSLAILDEFGRYIKEHITALSTKEGMLECLKRQYCNPTEDINVPTGIAPPENVWIYDFIAALSKAEAGKSQAFGYAAFANHVSANNLLIGSTTVGDWCSRFINQYFTRNKDFPIPAAAIDFTAAVLAEELSKFSGEDVDRLRTEIVTQYITKEYEATLLAHRGFEPLLALLINAHIVASPDDKCNIRTCFAEKAELTGQAGKTTVLRIKHTIINWQSATDAGRDHKRKELCGRAVGLRYTWNAELSQFTKRPGVEKLILLLDGTWRQKDLDSLVQAGWDEIYYPDEIDKLKTAII